MASGAAPTSKTRAPQVQRRPRRSEVRRRLLEAAEEVFAEHGFANATLDDVAAAAGLTKGAIYSNFAGKDELVLALMQQHFDHRERVAAEALRDATDASAGARGLGTALAEAMSADRDWQRLFIEFWLRAQQDPQVLDRLVERRAIARSAATERLSTAVQSGRLRSPFSADELTMILLAFSNGLALEQMTDPDAVPDGLFARVLERLLGPE